MSGEIYCIIYSVCLFYDILVKNIAESPLLSDILTLSVKQFEQCFKFFSGVTAKSYIAVYAVRTRRLELQHSYSNTSHVLNECKN